MKKNKTIEMKIYEFLGIKTFRKMAFKFRDILCYPFTLKMSKAERNKRLYKEQSNYIMGIVNNLEDVLKFKKYLYFNAGVHTFSLLACLRGIIFRIFGGGINLSTFIMDLTLIIINSYCIMLQRYNCIRINKLIKKMTPRYERQKQEIIDLILEEDSKLKNHTYQITTIKSKKSYETNIEIEKLIENASLKELKEYKNALEQFKISSYEVIKYIEDGINSKVLKISHK